MNGVRSPLFYVGDKYKLMPQLSRLFPRNINNFYDVFAGGGSVSLNTPANKYFMNDLDDHVIKLHKYLLNSLKNLPRFLQHEYREINKYHLTRSSANIIPNNFDNIKSKYHKTYFSKINKRGYLKLRSDFNNDKSRLDLMYLLLVYVFNHMTRFNSAGQFNLPVGNVDWNNNVENALKVYSLFTKCYNVTTSNLDFYKFINSHVYIKNDFVYCDPPYLISSSEYNKMWGESDDRRLFKILDLITDKVHWGLSDLVHYKGRTNKGLLDWINENRYLVYNIESNYISRFDDTHKTGTKEIYVTNYRRSC